MRKVNLAVSTIPEFKSTGSHPGRAINNRRKRGAWIGVFVCEIGRIGTRKRGTLCGTGLKKRVTTQSDPQLVEPDIQIDHAALGLWKHDQLANVEALLTGTTPKSQKLEASHHVFATRALVRARLRQWDAAIEDAKKSIKIQPSVIGYVAQSVALVGNEERYKAYRACDIAFEQFRSSHVSFLLLIKAIVVFMAGEHEDAISRVDDLISMIHFNSTCYMVQAYMYFLLGNSHMDRRNFQDAIQSFRRARAQLHNHTSQPPLVVSLITGWKFDTLGITIQQQLCEALCAAGHAKEAGEVVLETVNIFGKEVFTSEATTKWLSDFTRRCLVIPGCDGDAAENGSKFGSPIPSALLKEWARANLMCGLWKDALTATVGFTAARFTIYRALCEHLETINRIFDASECFHEMVQELAGETDTQDEQAKWVLDFRLRCYEKLERVGDAAVDARRHDDAILHYSAAISLDRNSSQDLFIKRSKVRMAKGLWEDALEDAKQAMELNPLSPWGYENILIEWANVNLMNGLWKGALSAARDFKVPRLTIYRAICEGLETPEGIMDAIHCFHQMTGELALETIMQAPEAKWVLDFRYRCSGMLERAGDSAMDSQRHDEALKCYSAALSIHPTNTQGCFIMRSKVCMAKRLWKNAVDHANESITFDPTSPRGYETKRAALHGAGHYEDAIQAFETMLSKMAQSPDPQIRERRDQYINPSSTRTMIRKIIQRTIRHSPRVLIDTTTGRLHDKTEQTAAFMSLPIVNELVSSMTTRIDRSRIKSEVRQFFRYVMLSHKWEENEPLFQQVIHIAVYDLHNSPTHDKLKTFCNIVRDAGFNWAWSDTCCIDKQDHFVLQEALVAMFKWYRGSAMMFVFLRGVHTQATFGDLVSSVWNTRAWTLQEYVATKVIRFYTEDWTPYLNLDTFNHKESPKIISEMEQATGVSAEQLMGLCPGLSNIREKLRLASTRQTTLVEDAAYSLLGIFSVSGIPAIYGEGESALGRLLAHVLAGSGDTSILAWTGQSGGHNSCLPAHITVFNQSATSHHPPPIEDAEIEKIITMLRTSAVDFDVALKLYDRVHELPAPWFAASRMKLPCISFKLPPLSSDRTRSGRVYRVDVLAFGVVEIKTRQDLSRLNSLYLVHPWIDTLLDREDMQSGAFVEDDIAEPFSSDTEDEDVSDEEIEGDTIPRLRECGSPSSPVRMDTVPMDRETRSLRLIARLRQPFGALLFSLVSTRRRSVVYRRIAADSTITVQLRENVPLSDLLDNVTCDLGRYLVSVGHWHVGSIFY
ncbi:TPR-like protein [Imleria badia]|nr:TPR-like protein [Imleria badia]